MIAVLSSKSLNTVASVTSSQVNAASTILTRIVLTFIYIYKTKTTLIRIRVNKYEGKIYLLC